MTNRVIHESEENPDHSAAYKLFHYLIDCTIPSHYLYSRKFVETFGVSSSGNKAIDDHAAQAPVRARICVAAMAMYYDEGAQIGLINAYDSARIYRWISTHLQDWQQTQALDISRNNTPLEDLRKLEAFGAEVYKTARHFMQTMPTNSSLFQKMDAMGGRRGVRRRLATPETQPALPEAHDPIVEAMQSELNKRTKGWR